MPFEIVMPIVKSHANCLYMPIMGFILLVKCSNCAEFLLIAQLKIGVKLGLFAEFMFIAE